MCMCVCVRCSLYRLPRPAEQVLLFAAADIMQRGTQLLIL